MLRLPHLTKLICGLLLGIARCSFLGEAAVPAAAQQQGVETTIEPASDQCWIFCHLQKCGGSTVKKIIIDTWDERSRTTYDSWQWKHGDKFTSSVARTIASEHQELKVVMGGYPEALRRTAAAVGDKCKFFTVFRHPIPRLVSAYFYCRLDPSDQLCASEIVSSREADLVTFAEHWGSFAVRQFALSWVTYDEVLDYFMSSSAGKNMTEQALARVPGWYMLKVYLDDQSRGDSQHGESLPDAAMRKMLEPVKDLLLNGYAAVGILEEFNTTLSLFNAALEMPGVDWPREFDRAGKENVDLRFQQEKKEALATAWASSEIKSYIRLDLSLYEHAVDVFHQQAALYGLE